MIQFLTEFNHYDTALTDTLFLGVKHPSKNLSYLGEVLERYEQNELSFETVVSSLLRDPATYNFSKFKKEIYEGQFEKFDETFKAYIAENNTFENQFAYVLFLGIMGAETFSEKFTNYLENAPLDERFLYLSWLMFNEILPYEIDKTVKQKMRKRLEEGRIFLDESVILQGFLSNLPKKSNEKYPETFYSVLKKLHKIYGLKAEAAKKLIRLGADTTYTEVRSLLDCTALTFYMIALRVCYESYVEGDNREHYKKHIKDVLGKNLSFNKENALKIASVFDIKIDNMDLSDIRPEKYELYYEVINYFPKESHYLFDRQDFFEFLSQKNLDENIKKNTGYYLNVLVNHDFENKTLFEAYYSMIKKVCLGKKDRDAEKFLTFAYTLQRMTIGQIYIHALVKGVDLKHAEDYEFVRNDHKEDYHRLIMMMFYQIRLKDYATLNSYSHQRHTNTVLSYVEENLEGYQKSIQKDMITFLNYYHFTRGFEYYLDFVMKFKDNTLFREITSLTDDELSIMYKNIATGVWTINSSNLYKQACQNHFSKEELAQRKFEKTLHSLFGSFQYDSKVFINQTEINTLKENPRLVHDLIKKIIDEIELEPENDIFKVNKPLRNLHWFYDYELIDAPSFKVYYQLLIQKLNESLEKTIVSKETSKEAHLYANAN